MRIAGIVINYRTADLTIQAVNALREEMRALAGPFRIYLVDCASGDDSVPLFRQAAARDCWRDEVEIIEAPRNGGFGYGINLAVRQAFAQATSPTYFYVLNSDAFADPGSLARLVGFLDAHPEAGLAGSHIRGIDGTTQVAAFRFPSLFSEFESAAGFSLITRLLQKHVVSLPVPQEDREVDWISGTSMLIRRSTFEQAGFFDEEYFLYFEEIDFCRTARDRGIKAFFVANAPITHLGGVSTGITDSARRMPAYWFESRHRYFQKHHGLVYATACDVARLLGMGMNRLKDRALGRRYTGRPHLLQDSLVAAWRNLGKGLAGGEGKSLPSRIET